MLAGKNNPLARGETRNVGAKVYDLASALVTGNQRQVARVTTATVLQVAEIHPDRLHPHQDVVRTRIRLFDVLVGQDFRPAVCMNHDSFHEDLSLALRR